MGFSIGIAAAVWHGLYFMSVFSIYMSRHGVSAMLAEQPFLISICYERCPYCYFLKPVVLVLSSLRFYLFKDLMEGDPGWVVEKMELDPLSMHGIHHHGVFNI